MILAALLLAGCAAPVSPGTVPVRPVSAVPAVSPPTTLGPSSEFQSTTDIVPTEPPPAPIMRHGTGVLIDNWAQPGAPLPGAVLTSGGDVTLNFADADIRDVAKLVLGNILGLNYAVDAGVQGTVTVQTGAPLARKDVLPVLEQVFRGSNAALVEQNGLVRLVPLDGAAKAAGLPEPGNASAAGYGMEILPLRYASADSLQQTLQPFVPTGATLQADTTRNVLLISGLHEDIGGFVDLVRRFDTNWLARMSFGLIPLGSASADSIAEEMSQIISDKGEVPASALRIIPIDRLDAVLVITQQPRYLDWARAWIQRLDSGIDDSTPHVYVYHVQYGQADDLADILRRLFIGGGDQGAEPSHAASQNSSLSSFGDSASLGGSSGNALGGLNGGTGTPSLGSTPQLSLLGNVNTATSGSSASATGSDDGAAEAESGGTRIVTDAHNNAIIIITTPRQYRLIDETLERLDVRPMQVAITATIAEVTLNDQLQYGLQWYFQRGTSTAAFTNTSTITPGQVFPGFSYLLSQSGVNVVLNALSAITSVDVVSAPEVVVLNNQTAELQVGDSVPIPVQQAQSTITANATLVNTISYTDTGVILHVTPRANANGDVSLDIEQEVSDVSTSTNAALDDAPTIEERRIKSTVSVKSGQTVALGGLISDNKTKSRNEIPVLGEIPVVGNLFKNTDNTSVRTELLVLIAPHILTSDDDAQLATEDLLHQMGSIQPLVPQP